MSCLVRGSINIDEFYHVPRIVRPGQTISATKTTRRLGGKGGNQARALGSAGGLALMDGCVGDDAEGRGAVESLTRKRAGEEGRVDSERVRYWAEGVTGKAIIQLAEDGENSIIILAGANFAPLPRHDPIIPAGTTHLLLANEIRLAETFAYMRAAHAASPWVTTVWNPSPMIRDSEMQSVPWECIDWLLVNEDELEDLARLSATDSGEKLGAVNRISHPERWISACYDAIAAADSRPNLACTRGADGVHVVLSRSNASAGSSASPRTLSQSAGQLLNPVRDTTGAGDCFAGFFTAGLMRMRAGGAAGLSLGLDVAALKEVLAECMTACAMCVEKEGAQDSYPTRAEVLERMAAGQ